MTTGEANHRTKGLLRLTMACNEKCGFCNVPVEDYPRPTPSMEDTLAALQPFLDEGAQTLTISGGEPTLLKRRLVDVIARAREGGVRFVELQTNAVLIDPTYAELLAQAGLTSAFVSLLSHVPELHDELTELQGSFVRCVEGIRALLEQGVRVTLNPVWAASTQHLVADYVRWVAEHLPGVSLISLSAVQPHGRAAHNLHLLPDYAVLAEQVPLALSAAAEAGIDVVNPYCGLPACVGWSQTLDKSVEAWEIRRGGWKDTQGIENRHDKAHGPACEPCALRRQCRGAWKAYWRVRDGSGISAPLVVQPPWDPQGPVGAWWQGVGFEKGELARILQSDITDLALTLRSVDLAEVGDTLRDLRRLSRLREHRDVAAGLRLWVHLDLSGAAGPGVARFEELLRQIGVNHLHRT